MNMQGHYFIAVFSVVILLIGCSEKPAPPVTSKTADSAQDQSTNISSDDDMEAPSGPLYQICNNPDSLKEEFPSIRDEVLKLVTDFYRENGYQPYWVRGDKLHGSAFNVVNALDLAYVHGLDPEDYLSEQLPEILDAFQNTQNEQQPSTLVRVDLTLTLSVIALAYDLRHGAVLPRNMIRTWTTVKKNFDYQNLMKQIPEKSLHEILESFAPQHQGYQRLVKALEYYRTLAKKGGWESIDPGHLRGLKDRELETGSHILVPLLRKRILAEGYQVDMPEDPEERHIYDDSLKEAVRKIQANRGLDPDAIIGPLTIKALNVSVEELIVKIVWSMERWRWLPEALGERYILVNLPEFKLRAYSAGDLEIKMGVIVGDSVQGTWSPVFADQMEYVIFRPYWNVPRSIIKGELLPEIEKDRKYLKKYNYEIVDRFSADAEVFKPSRGAIKRVKEGELQIRQTAGSYNALGLVKFIFPNQYAVYLHDTNQRHLFAHSKRDFSHGCIRVQNPEGLAHFALKNRTWSNERIHEAMYKGERQLVRVGQPIPVYIFYLTACATDRGEERPIAFFEDLYRYDVKVPELKTASTH
ncbi:MAG: L,D-transpeptidase family protein [Verrucomicrobiota bacterium]